MATFGRSEGGGRRISRRAAAPLPITLATLSATYHCTLIDLSTTGARVRGPRLPLVGEPLYLSVAGSRIFAAARWTALKECGLRFDEPLSAHQVSSLLHEAVRGRGLEPEIRAARDDWTENFTR